MPSKGRLELSAIAMAVVSALNRMSSIINLVWSATSMAAKLNISVSDAGRGGK